MIKRKITVGILAHVDAGKTTLSESILLKTGVIKQAGRVDSGDAYLDNDQVERERGITIYSKNARIPLGDNEIILIDTPGHVDFSPEMERTLKVLDIAILLISGPAGVQSHTKTLWSLLKSYKIPTIVFVNKMDMEGADEEAILNELRTKLSSSITTYASGFDAEDIASHSEALMEEYLENETLSDSSVRNAFYERDIFPVFFGSALKHHGIDNILAGISSLVKDEEVNSSEEFAGIVYKIIRDDKGRRVSFIRVLKGCLKVKGQLLEEKINEIRIYSGEKYDTVQEVYAGDICGIPGLLNTHNGDMLGVASKVNYNALTPVISYAVSFGRDFDRNQMLNIMRELEDEDPSLNVDYHEETKEIFVSLMGDVQTEVLKRTLLDRYGVNASFGEGKILYKETVDAATVGVGHFEPLRHYAEAHIKIEPLERGAGVEYATDVPEDLLDKNWQRLILTHLKEREHRGVLLGRPLTDVRFTLVAGRAHIKHTEGGDFRQATYRAVRQGLMELKSAGACRLLEPYYDYTLKVPENYVGRAMTDITGMPGTCDIAENDYDNGVTILTGRAPASGMNTYMKEITIYTKGQGELSFSPGGYDYCHNEDEVLSASRYDPESDMRNPSSSVFCMHGAGTVIPWNQVHEYKHVEYDNGVISDKHLVDSIAENDAANKARRRYENSDIAISVEEIDDIIRKSSHANADGRTGSYKGISQSMRMRKQGNSSVTSTEPVYTGTAYKEKYMLVDGYNVIYCWEDLQAVAKKDLGGAAGMLNDILCNYQAITGVNLIVVYDAYKVAGHRTEENAYNNITVVYTKEHQTADQYIERYANANAKKYDITVITSDGLEQIIIRGEGCHLISSREFEGHVNAVRKQFNETYGVK